MLTRSAVLGLLMTAAVASACQRPTSWPPVERASTTAALVWPQPPQRPRIRFVKAVAHPRDLGNEPSFWGRGWELLFGRQEEWFINPTGVVANRSTIVVADRGAQAIWILSPNAGGFRKVRGTEDEPLISPVAVALGAENRLYLADSYLRKVFFYNLEGKLLQTIADPRFRRPSGLAYDAARDRLYVADSSAHRIWTFAGDGRAAGAIGGRGSGEGEFNFPTHVAVDRQGRLYVTDALNFRLQIYDGEGKFKKEFGRHGDASGDFASPKGIAVDSEGHVYVVEALFDAVQIFDQDGRYLLTFGERGVGPGQFWLPGGIFIDGQDQIYVADAYNQRVQIFRYLAGGDAG